MGSRARERLEMQKGVGAPTHGLRGGRGDRRKMNARDRAGAANRAVARCKRASTDKFIRGVSARAEAHAGRGGEQVPQPPRA
eukprot:3576387-Prymnesium_polylepis.1